MTIKPFSRQNFAARNYNVINATPVATYSLSSLAASYNEGDTITITITTGFLLDGTVLYWTTSGTSTGADFSDGVTSGSVTITNNTGTVTRTLLSDLVTEGTETFVFELRTGSISGPIVASTASSNVLDTSISPLNYSVLFNGSSQYLNVSSNSALNLTADFTVECWAYATTTTNSVDQVFSYGNFTFMLYHSGTTWTVEVGNGTSNYFTLTGTASLNAWHHFAITRSGNTYTFWVNGISASTTTNANAPATNVALYIGVNPSSTTQKFTGYISNFRIVKGTALYTAAFSPPTTTLTAVANTSLLTCRSGTISDSSTNAFTITNTGSALVSGENPFGNYSRSFNGSSQNLSVAANSAFNLGTNNFTIEAWIHPTALPTSGNISNILAQYDNGLAVSTTAFLFALYNNAGTMQLLMQPTSGSTQTAISGTYAFAVNTWYHVAVVRNSNNIYLYVNGVQVGTTTAYSSSINTSSTALTIASRLSSGAAELRFSGYISNLRFVNGTAVYTAAFSPPTAPLSAVTNTSLLTCQYPVLFDASTNKFAITNTGPAPAITTNPFDSYAYAFNGSSQYLTVPSNAAFGFGTGDFTVEFWVYPTVNARQDWFDLNDSVSRLLIYYSGTNIHYYTGAGAGVANRITGAAMTLSSWQHIAVSRVSGNTRLFINGTQSGSTYADSRSHEILPLTIGRDVSGSTYATGYMSNIRVIKGTGLYSGNFTVPTAPLTAVANTSLLTAQYSTLFDDSTNHFVVTNNGASSATATNLFATSNPLKNYSGRFNGSSQYLNATNAAFAPGTGDFTIECWAFYTGTSDNNGIFHLTSSVFPSTVSGLAVAFYTSNQFWVYYGGNSTLASGTYSRNTWVHIALVRASNVLKLYVNGTGGTISASDATNYSGSALVIGGYYTSSYLLPGYISNFRIVKGTAVYTANFTPSATPLLPVANTTLLTLQSNRIYDSSPNQFTITNNGSTTMSYLSPFTT